MLVGKGYLYDFFVSSSLNDEMSSECDGYRLPDGPEMKRSGDRVEERMANTTVV
jgi:hypothetical protein